jgi:glycosyltransferase involved in cell wall biosynthesis
MKKIKILFIHHATGWGGAPINMINIINSLPHAQYKVHVLLLKDSIVSEKLFEQNIEFSIAQSYFYKYIYKYLSHTEVGYIRWYQIIPFIKLSAFWLLSRYFFANRELKYFDCDIIHLNSSVLTDWLAPSKKKGQVVIHIQEPFRKGTYDLIGSFMRMQMKKFSDHIVAISNDNAIRIGLPEKITIIYNYADVFKGITPQESYSSKKVLYIGGAAKIKGFFTLVGALDYIDPEVTVIFGGNYSLSKKPGNAIKRLLKIILMVGKKRNAAINRVMQHPRAQLIGITHDVGKHLNEVAFLVSPFSTPHFSRPVIEAYLHKKAAIGTDVKGMDEIIEHGVTGLIVPKDKPKALAEAINYLAINPDLAKRMGENGFIRAKEKFTPENIKLFHEVYQELLILQ